jgi:hypothetical protein
MKKRTALALATAGTALLAALALTGCSGPAQQASAAAPAAPAAASTAPATGPVKASAPAPGATIGEMEAGNAFYGQIKPFNIDAVRSANDNVKGAAPDGKAWLRLHSTVVLNGPTYTTYPTNRARQDYPYHGPTTVKSATVTAGATTIQGELSSKPNDVYHPQNAADLDMWFLVPADLDDFSVSMVVNNSGTADDASLNGFDGQKTVNLDFTVPAVAMSFHNSK